jgi:hypothetical protein
VLDRVELADLYPMEELFYSCAQILSIHHNLKILKKDAKWLELKKKSPGLAFSILEEFAELR